MILFVDSFNDMVMYYYDENMEMRCWIGVGMEGTMNLYTHRNAKLSHIRDSLKYRTNTQILFDTGDE